MNIISFMTNWPRLLQHCKQHGADFSNVDQSWYSTSAFAFYNNNYGLNIAVGELFIDLRDRLSEADASRLEQLLVTFCPALAGEGALSPPKEPDIDHENLYASLTPIEVKARLELLYGLDMPSFLMDVDEFLKDEPDELISGPHVVAEFLMRWTAALGQAAGKSWGLLVFVE
jgi:hypothetical protein